MKVIYKIRNIINNKIYIGSAVCFKDRVELHLNELRKNTHHCIYLQNAWNKYGENCFVFEIIEIIQEVDSLISREQYYLDQFLFAQDFILNKDKRFNSLGYNICPIAGSRLHSSVSEKTKKLISQSSFGKKKSKEHSINIKNGITDKFGKPVIDITNNILYKSISEASRESGLSIATISRQCSEGKVGRKITFRFNSK